MPDWMGTSATVQKALRLISQGALDRGGVDDLAAQVGIGSRHLRRLFIRHVGAGPLQIAQTRRLHFAKKLIDETSLSMTQVAFNAGYSSLRRFNTAFRATFQCAPTELRRSSSNNRSNSSKDLVGDNCWLQFRLPFRPPFAWESLLGFLNYRAIAGVEAVVDDCYRRTIEVDGATGVIEVKRSSRPNELQLRVNVSETERLLHVVERIRTIFDLSCDPLQVRDWLGSQPMLSRLIKATPGLRVPGCWDGFELAVRAILGQQITVKAATTLAGRVATAFGTALRSSPFENLQVLSPKPIDLIDADLENCGVISSRANAIRQLAREVHVGEICFDSAMTTPELCRRLCDIKGIGQWTADYICMRALQEPDAFPSSDLVLRKNASTDGTPITAKQMDKLAEPWRAYAAVHLWSATLNKDLKE
ncbi:MAG: AraC family transcriptional regulator of adaptative response / DNA-3-methyladenine glycosylase II [Pirellulaceae bacterium]|jgi:AraC family transcriptional regulator of adaptative response / DNA-3-methyladenine glycosylase II